MAGAALGAQLLVQGTGIADKGKAGAKAEIGLVDVAGGDIRLHGGEAGGIGAFIPFRHQRPGMGPACGRRQIGGRRRKHPQAQQGHAGGMACQPPLQRRPQLVSQPARHKVTLIQRRLNGRQRGRNLAGRIRPYHRQRVAEDPSGTLGATVIEDYQHYNP